MGDMDQGIKRLLQTYPQDLLTVAFPDGDPLYLGPVATDVAMEPQLITDTLQRARVYGEECIIDWEAEAYPSAEMPRRCFEYGTRTDTIHRVPVLSVVLFLQPKGNAPQSPYVRTLGPITIATWHFQSIEMYKLRGSDILRSGLIGLLPLVPFMADRSLEIIAEAAEVIKEQVSDAVQFQTLEGMLSVFGTRLFGRGAIDPIMRRLGMNFDIMAESPLFQEWANAAEARGEQKGLREGMREIVRRSLEVRFGPLDPATLAAVNAASDDSLVAVNLQIATASLDEIRARLTQAPAASTDTPSQP